MTQNARDRVLQACGSVLVVLAIGSAGTAVLAQGGSALSGVVRDAIGSLVPGATVAATNAVTGAERTAVTDAEGRYRIATPASSGSAAVAGRIIYFAFDTGTISKAD